MTETDSLFGQEHVRRCRETNGEVGHLWQGATVLLLTTKGRNSGEPRTTPLAYDRVGDDFLVLASKGGASEHPGWYRNLAKEPQVEVHVKGEVFRTQARTATGRERQRLWTLGGRQYPDWDRFQARTEREIPIVALERTRPSGPDRAAENEELVAPSTTNLTR